MNTINRNERKRIAQETLEIIKYGIYEGHRIETSSYTIEGDPFESVVTIRNEATIKGALDFDNPAILNFASAKHPGGGFLSGADAQEESLARATTLYKSLLGQKMYEIHKNLHDPRYTDCMIYSEDVLIIRDDCDELLTNPRTCGIITAAAVNAGHLPNADLEIQEIMLRRIKKVLKIAHYHGHKDIILGAWGCGVFKNDPKVIASLFKEALKEFKYCFDNIRFSILGQNYWVFKEILDEKN